MAIFGDIFASNSKHVDFNRFHISLKELADMFRYMFYAIICNENTANWLVGWSLISLFSTNRATSETQHC